MKKIFRRMRLFVPANFAWAYRVCTSCCCCHCVCDCVSVAAIRVAVFVYLYKAAVNRLFTLRNGALYNFALKCKTTETIYQRNLYVFTIKRSEIRVVCISLRKKWKIWKTKIITKFKLRQLVDMLYVLQFFVF